MPLQYALHVFLAKAPVSTAIGSDSNDRSELTEPEAIRLLDFITIVELILFDGALQLTKNIDTVAPRATLALNANEKFFLAPAQKTPPGNALAPPTARTQPKAGTKTTDVK